MSSCPHGPISRDRVRTSSNVLSSTMCAFITNHLTRKELRRMDEKEQRNGTSNDVQFVALDDANDNHCPTEIDISTKI